MDANERMPGDAEAAAAVEGMQEIYGRPRAEHAVGDSVTFQIVGWSTPKTGRIEGVTGQPGSQRFLIRAGDRSWLVAESEICRL
jgi:hypothetical protein